MNPFSLIGFVFINFFYNPILNLLVLIIKVLEFLHIPGELGFSIIILTILVRLLVWPFMASQIRVSKKMNELKPHLDALKERHKDDKQALATAQSALYKEHGINPAAGCLPTLIQLPVLIALYRSIQLISSNSSGLQEINKILYSPSWKLVHMPNPFFLGLNLADKPSQFAQIGVFILLVPVITGLLQYIQSSMMVPATTVKEYPTDSSKEKKEKESAEDTMAAVSSQMRIMMPLMIGYFAFSFPIALALYWNTMTVIGIVQQYLLSGWGGFQGTINKFRGL